MFSPKFQWLLHNWKRLLNSKIVYGLPANTITAQPADSSAVHWENTGLDVWLGLATQCVANKFNFECSVTFPSHHPLLRGYRGEIMLSCLNLYQKAFLRQTKRKVGE